MVRGIKIPPFLILVSPSIRVTTVRHCASPTISIIACFWENYNRGGEKKEKFPKKKGKKAAGDRS
jgi:hypothetical protein